MECTGWTVVQGFALCNVGGLFLALWRVDEWVLVWSFLVRFWVSFWCFVYFIITLVIYIHDGLWWKFRMLGFVIETLLFGNGIVAAIRPHVWLL